MDYESICGSLQTVRAARTFYEYGKLDRLLERDITTSSDDLYEVYYELLLAATDYMDQKYNESYEYDHWYFSFRSMMQYYRLIREYGSLHSMKLSENPYVKKAEEMLKQLNLREKDRLKTLSKGNKEKVQLILAMSRKAEIYFLDEPIGGVDPAARDYILNTIIRNYSEDALVVMSTHLIADIERVLDEAVFINRGSVVFHRSVDEIRETEHKSVDELFREVFRC